MLGVLTALGASRLPTPDTGPLTPAVLRALRESTDWISSWWTAAAFGALTVLLVALSMRTRGARRVAVAVLAVLSLSLGASVAVNSYVGYLPDVTAARAFLAGQGLLQQHPAMVGSRRGNERRGAVRIEKIPVPDAVRMPAASTWIYTPPGYDPSGATRYPVVYLIHGEPGTSSDWFAGGQAAGIVDNLIAAGLVRPMIVVAPDVNGIGNHDTECLDSTRGGSQVETYLATVLVPWVDAHLATAADRGHRIIGGMSSGAFCAMDQGLRHQDLYGTILAFIPYENPGAGARGMLSTEAELAAHDVAAYLPTLPIVQPLHVFVDVPGNAVTGQVGIEGAHMVGLLRARAVVVEFRAEPGQAHTWRMARQALAPGLVFASRHLPR